MSEEGGFRLHWHEGATCQVELFSPAKSREGVYQLKYTPPFRSTIRPPAEELNLSPDELAVINDKLDQLFGTSAGGMRAALKSPQEPAAQVALSDLRSVGWQLLDLVVPRYIQADLRIGGRFLEFGVDEALLGYPWELMHDGNDFLCLKNYIGRFVNATSGGISRNDSQAGWSQSKELAILLISVPNPQPRADGVTYEALPAAEAELEGILEVLNGIPGLKAVVLNGKKATYDAVWSAVKNTQYHIIHYCGHAHFNDQKPKLSALVLHDRDMTTGPIVNYFGKMPPVFCFINACETGAAKDWQSRHNIFGIARAFLETGAYLLGSRWKLGDETAKTFAAHFYSTLLKENRSMGESITEARQRCKEKSSPEDFGWASYVFYGDPSVCFRSVI